MLPSGPRPGLEEIEPRLLYSADAALLLGGLPVADVRQVASASAAASSQDDSGARWLLVDRRAEDWDRLLAEAQALDPSRPLQLRWVEPDEDGAALRTAVGEGDGAQAALVAAWTDADGRAWLGRSALDAAPPPPSPPPVAAALAAAVETGPAEDWTLAVRRELVIIDGRIEGAGALAALWWQDENSTRTLEVIVTDPSRDGLSQIGELLAARGGQEGLAALHLVGHGTAGQFSFGGDAIDAGTLARHEAALRAWGQALAENGDLLLYGCDTGAGSQGEALLEALQALTGADVAASTDATGGSAADADWELEAARGTVETTLSAPAAEALARWEGRLASYTVTDFSDNPFSFFTLRAAIDSANSSAGADTITFANFGVPMTIELSSMLPTITGTVSIDASSSGAPTVTLDGRFLGGGADGLQLYSGSDGSTVRGLRIQNFSQDGIDISGSGNHVIAGNWIGLDSLGSGAAGNQQGVNLWNTSGNRIGGSSEADRNIISGNSGVGIYIGGGSTANRIEGNWIGLDSTGAAAVGNLNFGILVESAGNTLGGTVIGQGNVIAATVNYDGIMLGSGASGTLVAGNTLGLNAAGTAALGNARAGLRVESSGNTLGGTGSSARNIVSGNGDGIVLSGGSASGNQILGNWVGLSAAGSSAIGNTFDGIRLENGASGNTLGGASAGLRNVISGNGRDGVRITDENSDGNAVLGNWIGSNAAGTAALGNGGDGIFIRNGADSSRIGGAAPGEGNWVIGAGLVGIKIDGDSTGTTIRGNRVGTDLAGTASLGAQQNGIRLENGAAQTSIVENTVAFSGQGGVYTAGIELLPTAGSSNLISRNTLYSNVGQDINLGVDGLDGNDSLDADSGVNDLQNHPLLSSATLGAGTLRVLGQLDSAASALYRIEFFADPSGQGDARVYLGQTTVTSDAGGRASIDVLLEASLAAGATVTATATRVSSGSTSEAAVPVTVAARANTAPGFVAASGQVITAVSGGDDWIRAMQIQDDGRILVAGHQPGAGGAQDVLLMRYRADGTLDTTFGSGGRVTVAAASFGGTTAQVWAMAVQADGAIVLAGQTTVGGVQYALVQRYLADGSLDSSFSGDGTALWGDVSQFCEASAVAIDAQGRIVLGGTVSGATAVARVTVDGMLDTAFGGGNGYAWVDAGLGADLVGALAIQSDGRILLGGSAGNDHALVRWNDDGTLDAGFGSGGIVRTDVAGGFDMIRALVVQDDGRILAGGYSTQAGGDIDFTLLRYLASGSLDTGFSGDGRVTTDLSGADIVQAMVRDASGRIVLAGYDGSGRIALVRHLADGSLDTAFGQGGLVQQAIGASSGAGALALRPDGRLVAAGWSSDGTQRDPLLLGLLTDGSLDPGVGSAAATLGGTVAWTEDSAAVVLDADVRLNDADLAQAGSYAGATLTLARQGGAQAQDQLAFDGLVVTVSGTAVLVDGVQVGSYTFTGGQMQVSFGAQATQDRVDRLARHIVYWNSSDAPPASVTIAWTLADGNTGAQGSGGALAGAGSVTVAITAVNDAPTLALPGRQSTPVDTPLVLDSASGRAPQVADADAALLQVTLTSDGHGLLTLSGTTGLSFSAGDGSADTAMTFSGSAAAINAALDGLRFVPSAAYQGSATIGFSVSDLGGSGSGGTLTTTGSVIVEVGALRFRDGSAGYAGTQDTYIDDSAPGSAFGTSTAVRADDGSPRQTALIRFDQIIGNGAGQVPAGATITSATLSLYVTERDAADTVVLHRMRIDWSESSTHASLVNGIQADGSDAEASGIAIDAGLSGWINISGLAAAVQAWVDGAPNFGWAIVSDAADTWAFASSESADVMLRPYLTVAYTVPQTPVLGTSAGGASYVENAAPVAVDPALTLSDADSTQLSGASVVISAGHVAAQDVLSWAAVTGISGSWNAATGTLSFSGTAALADYRTLLRSVSYANSSDSPSGTSRTLSFTVTDTTGLSSAAATRSIQISAVNDVPTVTSPIADQSATEDQPFSFQLPAGTFADVDVGDSLSYTTSTLPSWLSFNAATRTFSGTPANADVGALTITVTAKDGSNATASDSFVLTIANVNDAPTVASPIADQSATEDQPFSFQIPAGTFADVDAGDSLTYTTSALPSWLSFNTATHTFSGTPANGDVGSLTITVTAKDGSNATASDSFVLTVTNVNDAPTVASPIADQSATQDQPFSFQLPAGTFADVDAGDSLSYTTSALPSWLSFDAATRTFSGTPANADVGALTITVTAKDGSNATASDSFVLTVTNVNDAPTVATPIAGQDATEDQPFSFQIPSGTFADVDAGDSLSYTTSTLPSWLSFNAATRTFSGTPANADVGTLTITVTAKDGSNAAASDSFVLTIANVNDAPTVASPITDQSATEDQPFSFQIPAGTFADVDAGDSLSYTTSTLPSWLSFDAATRTFSGTPANADVGSLTITVTAKDGSNAAASDSFVLTIANVNDAPTVATPIADQSVTQDQPFSFQLPAETFVDVDAGDSLSYTTSTLPSWLSFDAATRTFSGTPTNADVGSLTITVTAKDGSNATASDSFVLTVANVNDAPTVASPIADQSATEDQPFSFQLPAGTFADVDAGDSLSYTTSALPSWLSFNMATRTFSGTPANADVGSLTITVTAKDGSNAAASDSFVLTIANVNDAPTVASPITDQSATEDQPFSFQIPSGTFADVDAGDSLSYTTSTLPSWLSFNAATRTFSGTPANADVGTLTITVTAKDGSNAAASDSFVLTIANVNDAPTVASPITDQSATEDQPFSFQIPAGTFADVDAGDSLSYTTSTLPSWLSFDAATRTFSGTPANADVGSLTITVTAKDGSNAAASDSFVLTIANVNDAPTVATPIADQSVTQDQPFSFQLPAETFVDVDAGDSLSYTTSTLPSWLSFDAATRTFSGTPTNADVGSLTITVTAKDGSNATASDSFVLTVANVNDAPTVASPIADQSATEDQPFSFQLPAGTFADVDAGDSLSYTTSTLPSWLSFDAATRTFSGTPANADVGALTITVTAKDGSNATASDSFVLTVTNVNDAPTVASPIADQSATEDQPFSFQLPAGTFADVDAGDSLSYTTSALPSWLSFNMATRTFSGTPANADVGSLTITVTAKDGSNAAASDSFVLTIANVNDAPTVASPITDQSATEDQPFSFQIPAGTFADVDAGDSLSYTTSTLPSWLSFDAATRTFSGTPANADVGSLTITVTAKDGSNAAASDSFVLTIANVNDAPTVATPIADQSVTQDQPFSFQLPAETFVDVDAGDSLSYTTSTLPSWLSFDAATRTFSGTPTNADVGSLTITVTAKDGSNATASDSFVLTVANVNDAPTVASPIADQSATEDQPFSFQLPAGTFADVDAGDSLSYTTSALPSWLSFNMATRTFSGTPANADVGSLTITVTAKDGSNAAASDSFVLTIANVNDAPTVASPITDQSATEDQPFSFQIPSGTFADVDAGDSLSYTTSTLPSWLSFNAATRTFSGTPANADVGTLTITVTAKDGSNAAASDSFVLTIANVNDAPTVASPITDQSATEDQPFSFQIPAGTFADVDAGDSLSYTTSTLPSWLSFDAATRTFSGTPANADVGSLTITVTAKDGSNAAASDSFVLTIANVNDAPTVATPIADQSVTQDQPFSFQLPAETFVDVDAGDSLSYTTSTLPSWLSFDAATRTFSGTPTNADVGSLTITVTAKDGSNATASDSFVLTVANVNDAPTVASPIADQSATEDQPFSFQLPAGTFADVDAGDSLSYTTSTLPSWLSFDAATRTFSGTPANADVGALTITVTAKDGSNATASDSFVLTVTNVNDAPTVASPIADQSATEDQPFSFQLPAGTFADVDAGDSLSYTTSALPSWLSFNMATRTFSGTPANADVGTLTITVTAKDGSNAAASDSFVLTIANVNDAPTVASPITDQSATEDQPFSFQIPAGTFADVDAGDSLSYTTSTLPSWLSFDAATRTFSGTPANADVGSLTITVTAKDGSNAAASDSFVLTIANVNDAPTVATPIADQSVTQDQPFSFQLPAETFVDVDAGDSLSYTTSTLPSWLSFDAATRTFSGTPTNADVGSLTITVTAKDGSNATASDSFVLTVANVNDAPTVASPIADQSATEDQPFSFQLPAGTFADVDAGDSLTYTTSALPIWLSFDAATRTFSGTPANADVGALTITVTAKDGSNATASDSFVLTVENVNDAPILQAGGPLTLEEGGHQVLTLADLLPADVDDDERSLVFERVGGAPAGRLERVDAPGVAVDRFSAGDLADGLIRYVHDGSESVSDRLELRVRDASGALSDPVRLEIVITPVDDEAPRIVSSDGQARVVLDHSENSPWQRVMQASDADRPLSVLQWRIAGGADAARFEIDADSGELRLLGLLDREQPQDADRDNHYEVLIEVSDGRQAATQQLLLRITDVDEAPEIEIGLLQVDQGMRLRLDESLLRAQDVDSAADVLVYRVVAVENGRFVAAGGNSVLTTFSQADVAAGRVVFQHDENSLAARFSLVLSDGRNESGVMSIEIAVRERGFDAGSMPTEPPPDRMPASSSLVVSGIEPADPMRERTQQAQASQEIVRAAVLRGLAAREGGGAGAAELVAGDLMAGWVDALRRFATLSASEAQAARPGALRGEVGFSVDLMRLPDSDLLVLLDVVLDLAGFEATALIRPVSEGVGGTQTASGETARSAGTDEPENLLQREWQSGTVARTGAVVMSAGALFWAVRAGGLAASLAFASPVWWRLDPLPVLQAARRETAGAEAGRRGWRDTGVTGELAGLAEDLLDRQG